MMDYLQIRASIERGTATRDVPRWTRVLLVGIAEGRNRLAAIRHPLGFLCFPVQRSGRNGVCVHLWSAAFQHPQAPFDIHSHSWDLVSYVLHGALRNQRVALTDSAASGAQRVFQVCSRGDVDEIRPTARLVSCVQTSEDTHRSGSVYSLPAGVFHATVCPAGEDVATVVLGRHYADVGDFAVGPAHLTGRTVTRTRCGPGESSRAARLIAARLEEDHA